MNIYGKSDNWRLGELLVLYLRSFYYGINYETAGMSLHNFSLTGSHSHHEHY